MADDLDGVAVGSSVPDYNAGNQYRVKEMDPDEAGGGKDFYDGFMRKKKAPAQGEDDEKDESQGDDSANENPIPVVETAIHDDIILSQRAQKVLDQVDNDEKKENTVASKPDEPPPPDLPHISFQA